MIVLNRNQQKKLRKLTMDSIIHEMGFNSLQEYDANKRILDQDSLWVWARDQTYFRMCERYKVFPMRQRINTTIPRTE